MIRFVVIICSAGLLAALVEFATNRRSILDPELLKSGQVVSGRVGPTKGTYFDTPPSGGFRSIPARKSKSATAFSGGQGGGLSNFDSK